MECNRSHNNHILYDNNDKQKIYYACHKSCKTCKHWRKPNNIWKVLAFFPYHCAGCHEAGYPDDFYLIDKCVFVCQNCKSNHLKRIRKLMNRSR